MFQSTLTILGREFRSLSDIKGERTRVDIATSGPLKRSLITRHTESMKDLTVRDNVRLDGRVATLGSTGLIYPYAINLTVSSALPATTADEAALVGVIGYDLNVVFALLAGLHDSESGASAAWIDPEVYKALRRGEQ